MNSNPSLFYIPEETTVQFYIDNKGGSDASFAYGSISIPIESIETFATYKGLPIPEVQHYFLALLDEVTALYRKNVRAMIDVPAIQYQLLSQYWPHWISMGYISKNDPRPLVLQICRPKKKA